MFETVSVFVFESPSTSLRAAFFVLMVIGNRQLQVRVSPEPVGVLLFLF